MSESTAAAPSQETKSFYFIDKSDKTKEIELPNRNANHESLPEAPNHGSWFGSLFRRSDGYQPIADRESAVNTKQRKVPVKIEPKVYFANERTFLSWLHMSVTLASISMAILAFAEANAWSQIYGLCLMPVAIAFCLYSLMMFIKRAGMIKRKDPGPYEDRVGPIVLASMLAVTILVNFSVKLYDYAT